MIGRTFLAPLALLLMAAQPMPIAIDPAVLRAEFVARSGSDTIFFAGDSHGLDQAARATLTAQARWLRMNPQVRAGIEGHADPRRTREYSLGVGERRATAVRDFLIAAGIPPGQLDLVSWGKERPVATGASEGAWALNRRVVTVLKR